MTFPLSKNLKIAEPSLPFLHEDIIIDNIVVRLPVKSLGKFRCTSKSWHTLLSTPTFAKTHLNFHYNEHEDSIIAPSPRVLTSYTVDLIKENIVPIKLTNNGKTVTTELAGSCHGLVLVLTSDSDNVWSLNLFNHITLENFKIPESRGCFHCDHGLGYDSLRDDYKIVSISYHMPCIVRIYSVKMGIWRDLRINVPYGDYDLKGGWFVNGCIHWSGTKLNKSRKMILVAFNVSEEEFKELEPPKCFHESRFQGLTLTLLGGYLAMEFRHVDSIDYWVMKEYGVQESWTKFTIIRPENCPSTKDVGVLGGDEIVFINHKDELVVYNWTNGVWRNVINVFTLSIEIHNKMNFRESLVSPKNLIKSRTDYVYSDF